jgi:hypothetical protein
MHLIGRRGGYMGFFRRVIPILAGMVVLLLIPLPARSQAGSDSVIVNYDSIQDARMDRMDWRTDSLGGVTDELENRLEKAEEQSVLQRERLKLLEKEIEDARRSSREYQARLRRFLWVSGTVIIFLLGLTFLILLMFGMKTRQLLERFKRNQQKVREELSGEISNQETVLMSAISAHDQRVKDDLKLESRKLRRRIKSEKKATEKDTRKLIKKRMRKLRPGKGKSS